MLADSLYNILSEQNVGNTSLFELALCTEHKIFTGHFPGNPIVPGVCQIQLLKELTERIVKQSLHLRSVTQCRFLQIISPTKHPQLTATITLTPVSDAYTIEATITNNKNLCLTFHGKFVIDA